MISNNKSRKCECRKLVEDSLVHVLLVILLSLALSGCGTTSHLTDISYMDDYRVELIDASDPSLNGPYSYRTYFYGSGNDKHRKEYSKDVDFKTEPVDANPFVEVYDHIPRYWGFGFDKLPLNGRVWFPDGEGPFPLVLIVHGNHNMKDFSDPGYEYLGKLLASRGFITVSVDENFLNQKFGGENDARAFVLLEHLKVWKEWNSTEGHPFVGKINMERIALVGHSRGGESVAHAAAFNKLSYYPDNANVTLDYDFGIRSVIAIAPCDGQYKPAGHQTALENVNYLVIHGGHDADANIFFGVRQFKRVRFTNEHFHFKSAIYIYRANHSRFNTAWGRLDFPPPGGWLINEHPIMDIEEQRKVAKVLISAFLETTMNSRDEYLPIFKDTRRASHWLPEDIYVNQYQDSNFQVIADFEEDFDVTTTTCGGMVLGENLTEWRETHVNFRAKGNASQDNSVVILWGEKKYEDNDDPNSLKIGKYHITLDPDTHRNPQVDNDSKLLFSIGSVNPHQDTIIDLSIELSDSDGNRAALPLSTVGPVHPALNVRNIKLKFLEKKFYNDFSERLLQTYEIPFRQFVEANSSFDPSRLENISFVFDRFPNGTIMLDDIGISK
jgi:hypothetical protein